MNKVYFVRHFDDYEGLYIAAPTRGAAKSIGHHEIGCDFFEVRTELIKSKETEKNGILNKVDIARLGIACMQAEEE